MKILIYALGMALLSMGFTSEKAKKIPSVTVFSENGTESNIQEYTSSGTIQLVSLWATWCGPCRMELDAIKKVHKDWKDKYGVEIIAISLDNPRRVKKSYQMAKDKGWNYTLFHDANNELASSLGIRGIPYSMLTDGEGNIISTGEGYYPGYLDDIEEKIKKIRS